MPLIRALASIFAASILVTAALAREEGSARVALVVGNGAYDSAPLRNAVNDARDVSEQLLRLGFNVVTVENADRETMQDAVLDFSSRLQESSTGLFYYAGHGIQARGRNYLLPVDADIATERALKFEGVDVGAVLEEMQFAGNAINIVILDACRNNPFERRFRGGSRGLAAIDAARGTLIAYATAPGSVAADGDGRNGLYTSELLAALEIPNLKVEEVFKRVRIAVSMHTDGAQVPWESSSLTGDFVFNRQEPAKTAAPTPVIATDREALFWETIKESKNPADYSAYLDRYPEGEFASLANIRVAALKETVTDDVPRVESERRVFEQTQNPAAAPSTDSGAAVSATVSTGTTGALALDDRVVEALTTFHGSVDEKAFAVGLDARGRARAFGTAFAYSMSSMAKNRALGRCRVDLRAQGLEGDCRLYMVNDEVVWA